MVLKVMVNGEDKNVIRNLNKSNKTKTGFSMRENP